MRFSLPLGAALTAALALVVAPVTLGGNGHGARVDDRLGKIADSRGKDERLQVIVFGASAGRSAGKHGRRGRDLELVAGVQAEIKVKDLDKLAQEEGVDFVALDAPVAPQGVVDYSRLTTTYPFADKAQKIWDRGYDGSGVAIALIDSGVAPEADLSGRLVQVNLPAQGWGSADTHGHGTMVASIAAGRNANGKFIGVAPGASVYALNVGRPEGTRASDVIDALQWVQENAHAFNIRVVNLSLGETVASSYLQSALDLAVERVWAAGIVVVTSAGNGGAGLVDFAPANDPLAITVGASDTNGTRTRDDDTLAGFSAGGVTLDGHAKPDLLAPGRLIAARLADSSFLEETAPAANRVAPNYATISGTSFSAPQVAGAAAILLQRNPGWSPDQVKWTLVQKGHSVGGTNLRGLDLEDSFDVASPNRANQGVAALVCAPGSPCLVGTTVASAWNSSSWNSSSWNSSSWNSSSWNASSWNSSSWNSSSWNSSSWNSSSWNSSSWNSSSWNSFSWN